MNLTVNEPSTAHTASAAGRIQFRLAPQDQVFPSPPLSEVVFRRVVPRRSIVLSKSRVLQVPRIEIRDDLAAMWQRFLDGLARPGGPCEIEHVAAVRAIWAELHRVLGVSLRIPRTQPTAEGGILLAWDLGSKHLELEVFRDQSMHWFYRDRETNHFEGTDENRARLVAAPLTGHLSRVALDR